MVCGMLDSPGVDLKESDEVSLEEKIPLPLPSVESKRLQDRKIFYKRTYG